MTHPEAGAPGCLSWWSSEATAPFLPNPRIPPHISTAVLLVEGLQYSYYEDSNTLVGVLALLRGTRFSIIKIHRQCLHATVPHPIRTRHCILFSDGTFPFVRRAVSFHHRLRSVFSFHLSVFSFQTTPTLL